jgi:hypothetical protein
MFLAKPSRAAPSDNARQPDPRFADYSFRCQRIMVSEWRTTRELAGF